MYAVSSLDEGLAWTKNTFGVEAAYGGEHIGLGTRNALLSRGSTYLEIIAPDPAQSIEGTFGERLSTLKAGGLVTWCAEDKLSHVSSNLTQLGLSTIGPNKTKRQTKDGNIMEWELLFPSKSLYGGCMPFFIDWLGCKNPKETSPIAGEFKSLSLSSPEANSLRRILNHLGLSISVESGERCISVLLTTKSGEVVLSSTPETSLASLL